MEALKINVLHNDIGNFKFKTIWYSADSV